MKLLKIYTDNSMLCNVHVVLGMIIFVKLSVLELFFSILLPSKH